MKHEIIIKNGIAGVEINGRFYTHTNINNTAVRLLDVLPIYSGKILVAMPKRDGEYAYEASADSLTPIPTPAHDWPAGTRVMVRDFDDEEWSERIFVKACTYFVLCDSTVVTGGTSRWEQCKLAEGE